MTTLGNVQYLSQKEACAEIGRSARQLDRMRRAGLLRTRLVDHAGRKPERLFLRSDLRNWLKRNGGKYDRH